MADIGGTPTEVAAIGQEGHVYLKQLLCLQSTVRVRWWDIPETARIAHLALPVPFDDPEKPSHVNCCSAKGYVDLNYDSGMKMQKTQIHAARCRLAKAQGSRVPRKHAVSSSA
jgi:hypothetical protein